MIDHEDFFVASIQTRDFEEIRELEPGWDQRYDLVRRGGFEGRITVVQNGDRQLSDVYWGNRVRYQGITPPGSVAMGLPIQQSDAGRWLGIEAGQDDIILQRAGHPAEFFSPDRWRTLVFSSPEGRFSSLFSTLGGGQDLAPETLQGAVSLESGIAGGLRQDALQLLQIATTAPKLTQLDKSLIEQLFDALECRFVRAIVNSAGAKAPTVDHSSGKSIVQRAEDYARSITHRSVTIPELCHECEVAERTLHLAFKQHLDVSPSAWLRTSRLNMAYKSLRQSEPKRGLIKAVALKHGFNHFGRFSEQYGALFDETPSATLGRS